VNRTTELYEYSTHDRILPIPARFSFWSIDLVVVLLLNFPSTPNVLADSFTPFLCVKPQVVLLAFELTLALLEPLLYLMGEIMRFGFDAREVGRLAGRRGLESFAWTLAAVEYLVFSRLVGDDVVSGDATHLTDRS